MKERAIRENSRISKAIRKDKFNQARDTRRFMGNGNCADNRPPISTKDYIQMAVLTPNTLLYGQSIMIPEKQLDKDTPEIKRCQRYINKCQEAA